VNGISALGFIALATVRNMLLRQIRRAREPRYLVATLFGLFYLGNLFFRPGMTGRSAHRASITHAVMSYGGQPLFAAVLMGLGVLVLVAGWLFGGDEGGIAFSEAEIQFLFPAPFSRRQLIHYKLVRSLVLGLLTAGILTLSVGRGLAAGSALFVLGAWLGVTTLSLHLVAASLTRLRLLEQGVRGSVRRALALAVPLALVGSVAGGLARVPDRWPTRYAELGPYLEHLLATPPLSWATVLLGPAMHVALAPTFAELIRWLPAALAMLGLHYAWALSTGASFEQTSIAAAERRGKRIDRMRRGQLAVRGSARPPFALSARGHPAFAIYWKNLTAAVRLLSVRLALVLLLPSLAGGVAALAGGAELNRGLAAILCAALAASLAFFGVQIYRIDFRLDLPNIDLLRSYPLRGADVALAEVLAPFTVLVVGEWLFLAAAGALAPADFVAVGGRLPLTLGLMVALPAFTISALVVQNAAALFFPAWIQTGTAPPRGIEAIGQRMLTLLGTLLAVSLALVPAALVAGVVGGLLYGLLGAAALPLAALGGSLVVAFEAGLAIVGLGRVFDRFDPSRS
jgi:ABC-2 type transport system permease protein